jgi:hypothetical protein
MIFEIAFVTALLFFITTERILHSIGGLVVRLIGGDTGEKGALKGYASMQLVGSLITFWTSLLSVVSSVIVGALSGIAVFAFWGFIIALFFSVLYVLQEYYSQTLLDLVSYWNDPIGPVLHSAVVAPLELVNTLLIPFVGIYNFVVWVGVQLWTNVLLSEVIRDFQRFKDLAGGMASFAKHVTMNVLDYSKTVSVTCPIEQGSLCYEPGKRVFDFLTPMIDLKTISSSVVMIGHNMCAGMNGPLEIATYPLLDINFAKGIHNILNGILFTVIQVPAVTVLRCARHPSDIIMCLPDFEPSFNMLTTGLRSLGMGIDNWIDVASIIIQKTIGIMDVPTCESLALGFGPGNYSTTLFGNKQPAVVGLTEGLYAGTIPLCYRRFRCFSYFLTHMHNTDSHVQPSHRRNTCTIL